MLIWRIFAMLLLVAGMAAAQDASITIDGRILWVVKAPRAGYSPSERARDTEASIVLIGSDTRRRIEEANEVSLDSETLLLIGRVYVLSVTDEDARIEGRTRTELYAERKQIVLDAINRYRAAHTWTSFGKAMGLSLGVAVLTIAVLLVLRYLRIRTAERALERLTAAPQKGQTASLYEIFKGPVRALVALVVRGFFWIVGLTVLFTAVSYILSLFPATAGLSEVAVSKGLTTINTIARDIVDYLPNLIVLLVIAGFTYLSIRASKAIAGAVESGLLTISGFHVEWAAPTYQLVRVLLILFAFVVSFPYVPGGDSPALRGVSIFIGVLVSLGSGSAMTNVIAGIILTYMRPFRVGDRVKIVDTLGEVVEKSLLVTRVRSTKNVEVIVPNGAVLGTHILNYSAYANNPGLILHSSVTIRYDAPWRTVHELLTSAALKTICIRSQPAPFVRQTSLNDFHVTYEINAYTDTPKRMIEIYSDLHQNIQDEFNRAGIEIMSPTYVSVRDGNTVTIPEAQTLPDRKTPSFGVHPESEGQQS